jgi:hypothetical protein
LYLVQCACPVSVRYIVTTNYRKSKRVQIIERKIA